MGIIVAATLSLLLALPAASQAQAQGQAPPAQPYRPDFAIPKPEAPAPAQTPAATPPLDVDRYVIGAQDNLSITVVDETELSGKYRIDTDGTLTFPYLGRVRVSGLARRERGFTFGIDARFPSHAPSKPCADDGACTSAASQVSGVAARTAGSRSSPS